MTTATRPRPRKTAKTTEERAAKVASLKERLTAFQGELDEAAVAEITARFDGYSARNAMLIAMQRPNATDVSGFRAWIERGRCVRKGETGIMILSPIAPRGEKPADGDVPPQVDGKQEKSDMRFKVAYVFDVTQTDPIETAVPA